MIIHIDMDSFYASVEVREHPELAGQPVAVGGSASGRGVVAAANYAARKFGVRSAMPMATALRRCPQLVCLPVNMPLYVEVSKQIHAIFNRYTTEIEPLSLDEAFLDVRASKKLFGSAASIARQIKQAIQDECGLIASAGVAPNKFVAKIASDIDKPDGYVVVEAGDMQDFLDPLPISRIWGVGKVTEAKLHQLGFRTIHDLRVQPVETLVQRFGKWGEHIHRLANGLDKREVVPDARAKSISAETTFAEDIDSEHALLANLMQLTEQVAARCRHQGFEGKTVNLKMRYHDFRTLTRSKTLAMPTNQTEQIWQTAKQLLLKQSRTQPDPLRLLGVGVSGFRDETVQQGDLFASDDAPGSFAGAAGEKRYVELDRVSDAINQRFGRSKIQRGRAKS
jgi:DNA polymerase-4